MKKTITLLFAVAAMSTVYAQEAPFQKGTNVISAGLGLGSALGSGYSSSSNTPGLSASYEHGVWTVGGPGVISLGGYLGFKGYKYEYVGTGYYFPSTYIYTVSQKWNYTVIGVRSAYHYNGLESDEWDLYGGAMLSYNIVNYEYSDNDPYNSVSYNSENYDNNIYFTLYIGGRYFFSKSWGAYAELGYGVSYLNIGASYKF
ncbi:MAG: hypothetical protein ABIT08_07655 [Bacteroidia bacterium]